MFGLHSNQDNHDVKTVARSVKLEKSSDGSPAYDSSLKDENILKKAQAATISLRKNNLAGIRAQVVVVLDHSGSMSADYESGLVQDLTERFLAFGLTVDIDGEIPVIPFDSRVKPTVDVNLSNYHNVVKDKIYQPYNMGGTDLGSALKEVRKLAETTDAPLFVAIVTDGDPNDRAEARKLIIDLARYPVFIKFLAVQEVGFLEELDDMSDSERLLDNVDAKVYTNVRGVSDEQFADDMVDEWDSWTKAAIAAGVLTQ